MYYQIGMEPVRVDSVTSIAGLSFASAWERRVVVDFDGESAGVLSREDLLLSMKAAGRLRGRRHIQSPRLKYAAPDLPPRGGAAESRCYRIE